MFKESLVAVLCLCAFYSIAHASELKEIHGDWRVKVDVDKITDEETIGAETDDLDNKKHPLTPKGFALACRDNKLFAGFHVGYFIIGKEAKVITRIDKEKPIEKTMTANDRTVASFVDKSLIDSLKGKEKLFARVENGSKTIDMEFSLKGFDEAIQPVLDACNK